MPGPEIVVAPSAAQLADDVVARLIPALRRAQHDHGRAVLALTAGAIMERVWTTLAASAEAVAAIDWAAVDVCWGDERFVPAASPDRNDLPAERILFSRAPFAAATRYRMPALDGAYGPDLDAAAAGYADLLRRARRPGEHGAVPNFDVVLLGIGPDGHCCSLFPDHPSAQDDSASVIAVRDSPKPPPLRMSLSFAGLNAANEIWVVVSGTAKAQACARALGGADRMQVPAAGARGRHRTLWLLDADAAALLDAAPPD